MGLVLLGCVPGGTASNVMTFLAHGDVPLSITITMCTTLLAPVLTPSLTLALAGQWIEVNFWNMFFSIVVVVLLPILLGLGVHAVVGEKLEKIKKVLVLVSTVCILLVIGMCVGPNQSSFTQNGLTVVVVTMLAVLLHHVLGLVAGYAIARVFRSNEAKTRALSLEVGLQNSGLSCTLAASAFPARWRCCPACWPRWSIRWWARWWRICSLPGTPSLPRLPLALRKPRRRESDTLYNIKNKNPGQDFLSGVCHWKNCERKFSQLRRRSWWYP